MTAAPPLRVLVVEDGHEYTTNLVRFLGEDFQFDRAGDGPSALARLADPGPGGAYGVVFLDMRFDRSEVLLGDAAALQKRFVGDALRARRFLEDNQGTYVLAAIRDAGHRLPVVFSYDFASEPRRFHNLSQRYGPLDFLDDSAGPAEIRAALAGAARAHPA